ncbi:hypothetical protein D3C80_970110 [compost metagenome]
MEEQILTRPQIDIDRPAGDEGAILVHAVRDQPKLLPPRLVFTEPADAGPAAGHGPADQGAAVVVAGLAGQLGGQRQGRLRLGLCRLPVAQQLGAVAYQLQHLLTELGRLGIFEAEYPDEFLLLQQGAIQTGADLGIGQVIVLAQHGLMGRLRETQGAAGAQGPDIAAIPADGTERINPQAEHRAQLLAAERAVGLVVPEDQPIGAKAFFEALQHGRILLLAGHLAQPWQLQRQIGGTLMALGLQADEPEGVLFVRERDVPLLIGEAHQQLATLAAGEALLYGLAQGIRQLAWPGTPGLIQPVERGLHHIGQGDQPLAAGVQAKKQRRLAGRGEGTERGRRHELALSC